MLVLSSAEPVSNSSGKGVLDCSLIRKLSYLGRGSPKVQAADYSDVLVALFTLGGSWLVRFLAQDSAKRTKKTFYCTLLD